MGKLIRIGCVALAALVSVAGPTSAQDHLSGRPLHQAGPLNGSIELDGFLNDAAWASAQVISGFTQVDPEEGSPVSERTEVRILFDRDALYIGARLYDRGQVQTRLGRRDMPLQDADWFGVVIDSYHDHRTGFVFDVNPSGVQRDAVKSVSGGNESDDNSWDAVWEVHTSVDAEGWSAEYRIPFSQIRFSDGTAPQTWGIQLERVIGRRGEYAVTTFTPKTERGGIPTYGHLQGVQNVDQGNPLELLPYTVARSEHVDPGSNPYRTDSEQAITAGVDLRYRVTSSLTLNATINPDFGQVEVDPAVVNLGVYETFFQERRPFFVEGSEIFDFGQNTSGGNLFYSRRIGRTPQLRAPSSLADNPTSTRILGAAKFTGKTESGWNLGIIEAVTAEETARYRDGSGADQEFVSEPLANYLVGRVRKDMNGGLTSIGGMLTATSRQLDSDPLEASLRSGAYAGGFDLRHEFAQREWVLTATAIGSSIRGTPEAIARVQRAGNHFFQRPDADHLEVQTDATSMTGYSVGAGLARQSGQHWRGNLAAALTSPEFEVNDLGFQTRTDRRDLAGNLTYLQTQPGSLFRNYSITLGNRIEHNYDWQRVSAFTFLNVNFRTLGFAGGRLLVNRSYSAIDDRSTRGGVLMERPSNVSGSLNLNTDARESVIFGLSLNGQTDAYGGWNSGIGLNVNYRSDRWNIQTGPQYGRGVTRAQYVGTLPDAGATETFGQAHIFAPLEQTQLSLVTRLNVTFTPRLSLETFIQPLIFAGDYGEFGQLAAPQSYQFNRRADLDNQLPNRDFNLRSLRGTAVLRWEWRPGSTLFLAWQQQRQDFLPGEGDFRFGDDFRGIFDAQPDNIFVLKVNYWWTP